MLTTKESEFLERVLFINPISGERMEMTKVEGAEEGHDCLQIICEGISGAFRHKIYSEEV